ncbi:hypothetical protein [Sorangium sp. So ce381]|uniref:hypothetical protein n=1 Tax=Sorangium sp. So ce381 TaxID=3133307 RepID=UPI003F5CB07E
MDLELHQVDLRYEELRSRRPARERRQFSSLVEVGQQAPIVVVSPAASERPVVIDGYKRVRLLRRLGRTRCGHRRGLLARRMRCCSSGCCARATRTTRSNWVGFGASCGSDSASAARS